MLTKQKIFIKRLQKILEFYLSVCYNKGGKILANKVENTTNDKKLNLKNDIIFKAFFSRKGNEKFLIDFLNSILKIEISKISIQEEVNLEQLSKKEKAKKLYMVDFV